MDIQSHLEDLKKKFNLAEDENKNLNKQINFYVILIKEIKL